jgi:hypothetical protein
LAEPVIKNKISTFSPASIALIYAHLGQKDTAFDWLAKAVDQYDEYAPRMNADPRFDLMRSDPRWAKFVHTMGLEPILVQKSQ